MAFTRVQTNGAAASSVAFSTALTSGTLLVCWWVGHGTGVTCSDPTNGTWTALTDESGLFGGSSKRGRWFYVISQTATTAVTVSLTGTSGTNWLQLAEYSASSVTYDSAVYAVQNANTTSSVTITSGAPTVNGLWLIGVGSNTEGEGTITAGTGVTNIVGTAGNSAGSQTLGMGEFLLTTGAHTGTVNFANSLHPTDNRGGVAIGFYEASSGTSVNAGTSSESVTVNAVKAGVGAKAGRVIRTL